MKLEDAKDVEKLVKTTIRLLIKDFGAERAAVFLETDSESPPAAVYGIANNDPWNDPTISSPVLKRAFEKGISVCLLDARLSDEQGSSGWHPSVLCVRSGSVVFYCDHSAPRKFNSQAREKLEKLGITFLRCQERLAAEAPKPRVTDWSGAVARLAIVLGLIWMLVGRFGPTPAAPEVEVLEKVSIRVGGEIELDPGRREQLVLICHFPELPLDLRKQGTELEFPEGRFEFSLDLDSARVPRYCNIELELGGVPPVVYEALPVSGGRVEIPKTELK